MEPMVALSQLRRRCQCSQAGCGATFCNRLMFCKLLKGEDDGDNAFVRGWCGIHQIEMHDGSHSRVNDGGHPPIVGSLSSSIINVSNTLSP